MGIHIGWSNKNDPPGKRILWITEGKSLGDFYGHSIAIVESDLQQFVERLKKFVVSDKPERKDSP